MTKPGWYPDPDDPDARRYWDGENWSAPLPRPKPSGEATRPKPKPVADAPLPLAEPPPNGPRRRGRLIAAAVAVVVIVAAGVVLLVTQPWDSNTTAATDASSAATEAPPSIPFITPPEPTPTLPAEPTEISLGSPLPVSFTDPDTGQVNTAQSTVTKVSSADYDSQTDESPTQGRFVIVYVTLEGTEGAAHYNPNDFYVTGTDGETYQEATYSETWGKPLTDVTVHAGETSRGTLVYDVPKTALKGKVYYSPNSDGAPLGYWSYSS